APPARPRPDGGRAAPTRPPSPALLLLHGFTDSAACWEPVVPALAGYGGIIATDARGHGGSGLPEGPVGPERHAADQALVLDDLGVTEPVVVIGHSMGALTAITLAATRPELVAALVLEDPPPHGMGAGPRGVPDWLAALRALDLAGRVAHAREHDPAWSEAELAPWALSKEQIDPRYCERPGTPLDPFHDLAPDLRCDTLLLYGDADRGGMVTDADADAFRRASAGAVTTVRVPGAGHNVRRDTAGAYVRAVRAFLDGVLPRSSR
ncbi:alpha/beta hydrolase, partial [Streptosporangium sp. NPDC023615]|uniref:alpha/beta fold hydrolase n=1 Tax=Streptosporangium sp. NPDC023615 TaxID=3154794 RepID=UPI003427C6F2